MYRVSDFIPKAAVSDPSNLNLWLKVCLKSVQKEPDVDY
jgi:acylpyruvate hydrolase